MTIKTDGRWFKDDLGRTLLLRGVNLGGSSKVPAAPDGATWKRDGFYDHQTVSFIGRPFPLSDADEHLARLRRWGLTFLRLVVTWEAIEHAGPGLYDDEYLDYLCAVVDRAGKYDMQIFLDPHQDAWSRFTGGDGAPGWTLEMLGIDLTRLHATGAAFTHQVHGDPYPRMIWPTNYAKYGCATLFTLFFGGDAFAPATRIDGLPVQEFLQSHYLGAVKQVARRLREFPHVVGYDTLNEPSQGYIGYDSLDAIPNRLAAQGPSPTILQGALLAAGLPQDVAVYRLPQLPWQRVRTVRLNPDGLSLYRDPGAEVWRQNGVWDLDRAGRPQALRPDHFVQTGGRSVRFDEDFFLPFVERFARDIQEVHPGALIFVCPPPTELQLREGVSTAAHGTAEPRPPADRYPGLVHEPHWYDAVTLTLQRYLPWLAVDIDEGRIRFRVGRRRRRLTFCRQLSRQIAGAETALGAVPTLIGETGIALNLGGRAAYLRSDLKAQCLAMDDTMQALESNLVSYTLWNYTADNSNEHGDQWNDEDLSIFSRDQQTGSGGPDDGGRALEAVVRPHPRAVPGEPLRLSFDYRKGLFEFRFRSDAAVPGPLEIYLPELQYPNGCRIDAPAGRYELDTPGQVLRYWPEAEGEHMVRVSRT